MRGIRTLLAIALLGALAACQSLPFAEAGVLPPPVVVEDGSPERRALNARVYDAATGWIQRYYYDPTFHGRDWSALRSAAREEAISRPTEEAFYRSLTALVEELDDRHTAATSPVARAQAEAIRIGRSGVSFGFNAVRRGDQYFVTRVRPDGPAAPAGVQIGWRLVSVNDLPVTEAFETRPGRADRYVFEDELGALREVTITAAILPPRIQREAVRRPDGVLVLRFEAFDAITLRWFNEQMDAALADPPKAIVLDLRDNPGGLAGVLGSVTARFYRQRTDFMLMTGRFTNTMMATRPVGAVWDGPLVVLVGPGSASASELFAALVQETGRGTVVGETSAGAVIGSRPLNLPDGGELSLSLHLVLTSQRRRLLEGVGVVPDILLEPSLEDLRAGRDPVLEAAAAFALAS